MSIQIKMFDHAMLGEAGDNSVERCNSHAVQVPHKTVVIHGTLIQASTPTLRCNLQIEASYEGQRWELIGTAVSLVAPPMTISGSSLTLDYPYVRLRATLTNGSEGDEVLFSAELVFSHQ